MAWSARSAERVDRDNRELWAMRLADGKFLARGGFELGKAGDHRAAAELWRQCFAEAEAEEVLRQMDQRGKSISERDPYRKRKGRVGSGALKARRRARRS